jgi:phospholipid transport system substrate-binding protein
VLGISFAGFLKVSAPKSQLFKFALEAGTEAQMNSRMKRAISSLALVLSLAMGEALAKTPLEEIRQTIQEVQQAVHEGMSASEERRNESLRQVLLPRFDWAEIAKLVLGKHWDGIEPRQTEFIAVFQDFLGNAYARKIISFKDEKVLFVRESVDRSQAQVDTKIIPNKGDTTTINYHLRRVDDEWKISDVIVEDISIVGNYRAQFSRILSKGSFEDLLKQLKDKPHN